MKICMIGSGYVGLVSGACFADFGWDVICVDKDVAKVESLRAGDVPIYEPGLDELLARNISAGRLSFTTDVAATVPGADVIFLAVGTPMRRGDGYADLSYVYQAVEELAPHLDGFTVITTKSTVPVGTSREIERRLRKVNPNADFAVASNPEFLREGSAIQDFTHPDRVLIGCDDKRADTLMRRLYQPLALRNAPIMTVSRESAELAKCAANAFLATKISFINEIADVCEAVGANVQEAQASQSDADFISKYSIACKEVRETHYWLRLLAACDLIDPCRLETLTDESDQLVAILTTIVKKMKSSKSEARRRGSVKSEGRSGGSVKSEGRSSK